MANTTSIEWTRGEDGSPGATWNVVTGCTKVSPGCDHCYAETFAERWRGVEGHHFEQGFDLVLRPERLALPLSWKKPRKIFVNSMSDLFHDDVPDEFIAQVFVTMARTPQHTYQILTKRHARMRALIGDDFEGGHRLMEALTDEADSLTLYNAEWPLPNVWLGVSAENQKWADIRIPALLETEAAVRFVSAEPLLGPINLQPDDHSSHAYDRDGSDQRICLTCSTDEHPVEWTTQAFPALDWVIVGGESGPGARPMQAGWAIDLELQCAAAGVPFFFKQAGTSLAKAWGCTDRKGGDPSEWPTEMPRQYPTPVAEEAR